MKYTTVYTMTGHCDGANEVVQTLRGMGLGRATVADECRKIASGNGPRSGIYREAAELMSPATRKMPRECNALGGA